MDVSFTAHALNTATPNDADERRRHLRHACTGLIDVYRAGRRVGAAIIENISESGLRFRMDVGVEPGTELRMRNRYVDFRITVLYADRQHVGYSMGGQFSGHFRWSSIQPWPVVTPAHVA